MCACLFATTRVCYSARAYGKAVPIYVSSSHLRRLIVSEMSYSSISQPGRRESSTGLRATGLGLGSPTLTVLLLRASHPCTQASAQPGLACYWSSWHEAARDSSAMRTFLNMGGEDRCLGFFMVAACDPELKDRRNRLAETHLSVEWRA